MNIAKITNRTALVTVTLLVYWVFIFISCTVFDFTIFKEGLTTAFGLSVLGIFAVLSGAIILNIMYNLTAIAEARQPVVETSSTSRRPLARTLRSRELTLCGSKRWPWEQLNSSRCGLPLIERETVTSLSQSR